MPGVLMFACASRLYTLRIEERCSSRKSLLQPVEPAVRTVSNLHSLGMRMPEHKAPSAG